MPPKIDTKQVPNIRSIYTIVAIILIALLIIAVITLSILYGNLIIDYNTCVSENSNYFLSLEQCNKSLQRYKIPNIVKAIGGHVVIDPKQCLYGSNQTGVCCNYNGVTTSHNGMLNPITNGLYCYSTFGAPQCPYGKTKYGLCNSA